MSKKHSVKTEDTEVKRLRAFVDAFLDNFKDCECCGGGGLENGDTCPNCHGTGEQIDSVGILYVDLKNAALELKGN